MARCMRRQNLDVHHRRRDGSNGIGNAVVLCGPCHEETSTYGEPGPSPPAFSREIKDRALKKAGYRCECTSLRGCH